MFAVVVYLALVVAGPVTGVSLRIDALIIVLLAQEPMKSSLRDKT